MRRHHDAAALLAWTHCHLGAVLKATHESTFRTAELLIWGKGKPKLDLSLRKQLLVFATHDHRQSRDVREGGSGPIPSVEPQQHTCCWQLMGHKVLLDLGHGSAEFLSGLAIAWPTERAEPLVGMSLQDRGSGADNFSSLPPSVARSTE